MLRYYWLPINHYLLHLVGFSFTYLSKMHGHSNIKFTKTHAVKRYTWEDSSQWLLGSEAECIWIWHTCIYWFISVMKCSPYITRKGTSYIHFAKTLNAVSSIGYQYKLHYGCSSRHFRYLTITLSLLEHDPNFNLRITEYSKMTLKTFWIDK